MDLSFQVTAPAVPMHGCESALSTQMMGPSFKKSSLLFSTRPSMPTPASAAASSLAMNTCVHTRHE